MALLKRQTKRRKVKLKRQKNTVKSILPSKERGIKMSDFREYLHEQLKNDTFRAEYEKLEPEFSIIQAVIDARKTQHMTQKELSEKTGIAQSDISKLENGNSNPTIGMLQRLADGMGMNLKLQFVPKQL